MGKDLQSTRGVILLAALAFALSWSSSAFAQSREDRRKALEHFEQGEAYMKVQAYDKAVEEYRAAYEAVPKPGFLFNIGMAYKAAGEKRKALEHFRKYLALEPNGRASTEARAYATSIEREIKAEEDAAAEEARRQQEVEEEKEKARARARAAAKLREKKEWDGAADELRAAFDTHPDPEYVFQLAEVYRLAGDRPRAIVEYERYRTLAPNGPHSPDAFEKITKLKLEIEEASRPEPRPASGANLADPNVSVSEKKKEKKKSGLDWHWLAIGAAAVAAGLVSDLAPSNAKNGELDGSDFIPVGLYGVGGLFLIAGVF